MFKERRLKGRHVAVLAADGFEMIELAAPMTALRAAGATVDVVSLRRGRIRGVNLHEPAGRVGVDRTIDDVSVDDYDALLIPGGIISPDLLRQSAAARDFVRRFDATKKPIATLCHGPWVLASAGLVKGRTMTSWPGVRDDLVHAGATWVDAPLVRHRNWLTSRGPQDIVPFVNGMVQFFGGETPAASTRSLLQSSSAQRDAPPAAMVSAIKWLPRPSLRTAAVIGAALAVYAVRNRGDGDAVDDEADDETFEANRAYR